MIIQIKKKGKTGICPACNKKRRKAIETRIRKIRDMNFGNEKCFIVFETYRIKCIDIPYNKVAYFSIKKILVKFDLAESFAFFSWLVFSTHWFFELGDL